MEEKAVIFLGKWKMEMTRMRRSIELGDRWKRRVGWRWRFENFCFVFSFFVGWG